MKRFWLILLCLIFSTHLSLCSATVAPVERFKAVCSSVINPHVDWYILVTAKDAFETVHIAKNNECLLWHAFLVPETANFKEIVFKYDYDYETTLHHPKVDTKWSFYLWELFARCSYNNCDHYPTKNTRTDWYTIKKDWKWWYELANFYSKTWINIKNFYAYLSLIIWAWIIIITIIITIIKLIINRKRKLNKPVQSEN